MQNLILIIAIGTALFTAIAALANSIQAARAAQANEVNVYLGMLKEYGSSEMRTAISELALFWRTRNRKFETIGAAFVAETQTNPEGAAILRGYCRLLSSYFVNAARLYEAGLISRKLLRLLISHPGLNVFYDVAVPINLSKNLHHNSGQYASLLRAVIERHGAGTF